MKTITRAIVLLIGTVLVAGSVGAPTSASVPQDLTASSIPPAASSDVLLVAPGKIGALRMGASKKSAKRRGWIRYSRDCGWSAGPRALRFDADGNEVFKAYPDKVTKRKVRSMHAFGNVVTKKGIRAASLEPRRSSRKPPHGSAERLPEAALPRRLAGLRH